MGEKSLSTLYQLREIYVFIIEMAEVQELRTVIETFNRLSLLIPSREILILVAEKFSRRNVSR
jgi:hypothetical protein